MVVATSGSGGGSTGGNWSRRGGRGGGGGGALLVECEEGGADVDARLLRPLVQRHEVARAELVHRVLGPARDV